MLTYYCPQCWKIVEENLQFCPACGYKLADFHHRDFDDKLIAALDHPVAERRIMAAQVLGNRQCTRALAEFQKILVSEEIDYFFLRSILLAVMKMETPLREEILAQAMTHPSELVSKLAEELLEEVRAGKTRTRWDRNTA